MSGLDLPELLCVLADDRHGLRVGEEVADVAGGARRVHRDSHRADPGEREIDERPLEAVSREQRYVVALAHAAREEPVRVVADALVGLLPRDLMPTLVGLDEVGGTRSLGSDRVEPELRDRAPAGLRRGRDTRLEPSRSRLSLATRGILRSSANLAGPTPGFPLALPCNTL